MTKDEALIAVNEHVGLPGMDARILKTDKGRFYQIIERLPNDLYNVWGLSQKSWADVVLVVKARWAPVYENFSDDPTRLF